MQTGRAAAQDLTIRRALERALNSLNVLVRDFPATAHANAEIHFGAPSTNGLGMTINAPSCGGNASGICISHAASYEKEARRQLPLDKSEHRLLVAAAKASPQIPHQRDFWALTGASRQGPSLFMHAYKRTTRYKRHERCLSAFARTELQAQSK